MSTSSVVRQRYDAQRVGSTLRDWIVLLKPRVISLVVFTGAIGMYLAPAHPHFLDGFMTILCICLASGAAGAINMWYDRDIDVLMNRTQTRPIPAGRIAPQDALIYGCVVSVFSVVLLWVATNLLAAAFLAFSIFFYTVIYTCWLKRTTPQNIVIGGAAGAFPPIIGWVGVTGHVAVLPVVLFAIIFLWTPPHFWSLSLYACKDYTRAGIPMLPVKHGLKATRWHILAYTFVLMGVSLLPSFLGEVGWLYTSCALLLGVGYIYQAVKVVHDGEEKTGISQSGDKAARLAFRYSLFYLFFLFSALVADHAVFQFFTG